MPHWFKFFNIFQECVEKSDKFVVDLHFLSPVVGLFSSRLPWSLVHVGQFASIDPLILCSGLHLLLFSVEEAGSSHSVSRSNS